ncbi:hypothetical protein ABTM19_20205, partial [Acinetobacter baumannii]
MGAPIGDSYHFDSGRVKWYKFLDFKGRLLNKVDYKNDGTILSKTMQMLFLDSISFSHSKKDSAFIDMGVLVSNPYKCSTDFK